jgi:hypothetical protein
VVFSQSAQEACFKRTQFNLAPTRCDQRVAFVLGCTWFWENFLALFVEQS